MSRLKLILLTTIVLVLGAGVVIGRVSSRLSAGSLIAPPPPQPGQGPSWLADQLDLNSTQRQKMDALWADTRQKMDESWEHRRDLDHQRDQEYLQLLTEPQRAAYEEILTEYRAERADLEKQRDAIMRNANERSRAILDDTQKLRWDTLTKDHPWHGPHGPGSRSATRPAGPGGPDGPWPPPPPPHN